MNKEEFDAMLMGAVLKKVSQMLESVRADLLECEAFRRMPRPIGESLQEVRSDLNMKSGNINRKLKSFLEETLESMQNPRILQKNTAKDYFKNLSDSLNEKEILIQFLDGSSVEGNIQAIRASKEEAEARIAANPALFDVLHEEGHIVRPDPQVCLRTWDLAIQAYENLKFPLYLTEFAKSRRAWNWAKLLKEANSLDLSHFFTLNHAPNNLITELKSGIPNIQEKLSEYLNIADTQLFQTVSRHMKEELDLISLSKFAVKASQMLEPIRADIRELETVHVTEHAIPAELPTLQTMLKLRATTALSMNRMMADRLEGLTEYFQNQGKLKILHYAVLNLDHAKYVELRESFANGEPEINKYLRGMAVEINIGEILASKEEAEAAISANPALFDVLDEEGQVVRPDRQTCLRAWDLEIEAYKNLKFLNYVGADLMKSRLDWFWLLKQANS